eukprot:scaffold14300_cov32-Phaeocystis_antarctica.AAC.1
MVCPWRAPLCCARRVHMMFAWCGARLQGARDTRHGGGLRGLRRHGRGVRHALDGHQCLGADRRADRHKVPLKQNRHRGPLDGGGGARGGGHAGQAGEGAVLQVLEDRGVGARDLQGHRRAAPQHLAGGDAVEGLGAHVGARAGHGDDFRGASGVAEHARIRPAHCRVELLQLL